MNLRLETIQVPRHYRHRLATSGLICRLILLGAGDFPSRESLVNYSGPSNGFPPGRPVQASGYAKRLHLPSIATERRRKLKLAVSDDWLSTQSRLRAVEFLDCLLATKIVLPPL
jgi:hypothetical protein